MDQSKAYRSKLEHRRQVSVALLKFTKSQYYVLAFIAYLQRVNDEDLLSEIAQYDPLSFSRYVFAALEGTNFLYFYLFVDMHKAVFSYDATRMWPVANNFVCCFFNFLVLFCEDIFIFFHN